MDSFAAAIDCGWRRANRYGVINVIPPPKSDAYGTILDNYAWP